MKNVLIVEDSAVMRQFIISSLLTVPNLHAVEACNGFEALKALPDRSFDIILTDINMPDINGLELLTFLKKHPHYQQIPVIIISTERSATDRQRGMALGADDYLTKPFEPQDLESVVRRLLKI